jgi:transcriptional regulator with XRE-family HTH domain
MPNDENLHVGRRNPHPPELSGVTERLRQAVSKAGGPTRISERAGISLSTLNNYLGGGEIKLSNLLRLARVCGVTVEWLATGTGPLPRWLRKDAAVMGLSSEPQAPLRPPTLDLHWLTKAIEVVDALGGAALPPRERAVRIARSYELMTMPEDDQPRLPQMPGKGR